MQIITLNILILLNQIFKKYSLHIILLILKGMVNNCIQKEVLNGAWLCLQLYIIYTCYSIKNRDIKKIRK